uniref:TERF1-interacting nuclear factor 2 N-terminal domain-containing protein n=1 Tax=Cyprinus carpio carpio TaxID=630221 RepID=A0A9J8DFV5_CYPCA
TSTPVTMWKVMLQRDAVHYGKLEETITSLCETVPGLLHYRHHARLTIGLRALVRSLKSTALKTFLDLPDAQCVLQELHKLQESSTAIGKVSLALTLVQSLVCLIMFC